MSESGAMSESMVQAQQVAQSGGHAAVEEHEGAHPNERQYILVAIALAVLTAIEVALYYIKSLPHAALTSMLAILALAKFAGVVAWFMHLKFDSKLFRRLFLSGLLLAVAVYVATLATFHVFTGGMPQQ